MPQPRLREASKRRSPGAFRLVFAAALLLLSLASCSPVPERCYFHDSDGRIVVYHGVNVSSYSKYAPDFLPWQTREDFARLRDWGFNAVRYLVFWDAIEPTEGAYNETYLDATLERIGWLNELGVEVLVDLHQDLYSKQFGGDGFPLWATDDGGYAFHPRQLWNLDYLEPAVMSCFTHFWNDRALQDKYAAMLRHLLQRIDGLPNIIGVDIMNEPFPGAVFDFEPKVLSSFYNRLIAMRDEAGFRTTLFFEPVVFTSAGLSTRLQLKSTGNCAYAPHYYDLFVHEGTNYSNWVGLWMHHAMALRVREMRRFEAPTLFGEFGVDGTVAGARDYLSDFLGQCDRYVLSWTYYTYDRSGHESMGIVDEDGNENVQLDSLVRVYPQRIAGKNPVMRYETTAFHLTYTSIETAAPTVLFVPSRLSGACVTFNGETLPLTDGKATVELQNVGPPSTLQRLDVAW